MKKTLLAFLFSVTSGSAALAEFIDTPIDPWKVTNQQISSAMYTCGMQMIRPFVEIPECFLSTDCNRCCAE